MFMSLFVLLFILGLLIGHKTGVADDRINCDNCDSKLAWCLSELEQTDPVIAYNINWSVTSTNET